MEAYLRIIKFYLLRNIKLCLRTEFEFAHVKLGIFAFQGDKMGRNHFKAIRKAAIELAEHKLCEYLSLLAVSVP